MPLNLLYINKLQILDLLCQDSCHSILACVVSLEEHVLELRVDILNLLVHLLENQGYWQHAITSYLIYTIVLIVHYLR